MQKPKRIAWQRWLLLALLMGGVALGWASSAAELFTPGSLKAHYGELTALVAARPIVAGFLYMLLYTVICALALPVALWLTVAGGALFGVVVGSILTVSGATIGAVVVFLLARGSLGAWLEERFDKQVNKVKKYMEGNVFTSLFILRMVPLFPFFLVNIAPALVGVNLRIYAAATFLGMIPGSIVYTLAGAGLGDVIAAGGDATLGQVFTPTVIVAIGGLALLALMPTVYRWLRPPR